MPSLASRKRVVSAADSWLASAQSVVPAESCIAKQLAKTKGQVRGIKIRHVAVIFLVRPQIVKTRFQRVHQSFAEGGAFTLEEHARIDTEHGRT